LPNPKTIITHFSNSFAADSHRIIPCDTIEVAVCPLYIKGSKTNIEDLEDKSIIGQYLELDDGRGEGNRVQYFRKVSAIKFFRIWYNYENRYWQIGQFNPESSNNTMKIISTLKKQGLCPWMFENNSGLYVKCSEGKLKFYFRHD